VDHSFKQAEHDFKQATHAGGTRFQTGGTQFQKAYPRSAYLTFVHQLDTHCSRIISHPLALQLPLSTGPAEDSRVPPQGTPSIDALQAGFLLFPMTIMTTAIAHLSLCPFASLW
jgi:hypothetical protein